jgi:hypothetical protein
MPYEEFEMSRRTTDECSKLDFDELPMCINGHHCLASDDDRLKYLDKQYRKIRCQCGDTRIELPH